MIALPELKTRKRYRNNMIPHSISQQQQQQQQKQQQQQDKVEEYIIKTPKTQ